MRYGRGKLDVDGFITQETYEGLTAGSGDPPQSESSYDQNNQENKIDNVKEGADIETVEETARRKRKLSKNSDVDFEEECGDNNEIKPVEESSRRSRKSRKADVDFEEECGDKIEYEKECGDNQPVQFKDESAKPKKKSKKDVDVDFDDEDEDIDDDTEDDDEKDEDDSGLDDVDVDDVDVDMDDDDDDEDEKPSKSKSKKNKKNSKKDVDIDDNEEDDKDDDEDDDEDNDEDDDVDFEDECGDPANKSDINFKEEGFFDRFKKKDKKRDVDFNDDEDEDEDDGGEDDEVGFDTECGDVNCKKESGDEKIDFDEEGFFDRFRRKKNPNMAIDDDDHSYEATKSRMKGAAKKMSDDASSMKGDDDLESLRKKALSTTDMRERAELMKQINEKTRVGVTKEEAEIPDNQGPKETEGDGPDSGYVDYVVRNLDKIEEVQLESERQALTALIDSIYKEYLTDDFDVSDEYFIEMDDDTQYDGEDQYYQERAFGGVGSDVKKLAKPMAKAAKKLNDMRHGVGKHGLIRNTINRTGKDLKRGGIIYKILTFPFLIIKNFVQTIYHKIKSFAEYRSALRTIEVTVNHQITKLKRNVRNVPKAAAAEGIGYVATSAAGLAKDGKLPLKPDQFLASAGARLIEDLGRDNMLRALTSKLAGAIEESPEAIREVLSKGNKNPKGLTPEDGESDVVLSVNSNKVTVEGLVDMKGIETMLDDIDEWCEIVHGLVTDVNAGDESSVKQYLDKCKDIEDTYIGSDGKLDASVIFNSHAGSVKLSDFYAEISSKLAEKAKMLERGLDELSKFDQSIKSGNLQVASDTQKTIAELNASIQHTCNAFVELINSIDDLGKYVIDTMHSYVNCLEATSAILNKRSGLKAPEEVIERTRSKIGKFFNKEKTPNEEG